MQPDDPGAPDCRCGHTAHAHVHLHDRTYCGSCPPDADGRKGCPRYRSSVSWWSRSPIGNATALLARWALSDRHRPR